MDKTKEHKLKEKLGRFNLIEENICDLDCNCGWNITIGGLEEEDLVTIKNFLKNLK